jgi:hypothetical protein
MTTVSIRRRAVLPFLAIVAWASFATAQSFSGTWTGVQVLESPMVSSSPPEIPVVACDASGHAVAVWTSPSMGVVFTERYPGGTWSAVNSILPGVDGYAPQVAIGASGVVAASWVVPGQELIPPKLVVSVRPTGGAFGVPTQIASGVNLFDSKLGVALNGSVTIVWPQAGAIKTAMRSRAGVWSASQALSPASVNANAPDLAENSDGAAVVVWQQSPIGGPGTATIGAAYRAARSVTVWGAAQVISTGSVHSTWSPKAGIDATGDVAIGYGDGNTMMLVTKRATGNWGVPMTVSPRTDAVYSTALAMDLAGNVLTAWQSLDASNYGTVSKRQMSASGAWGPVTVLSAMLEDASAPMASMAADGSLAAVTWVDNSTFAASTALGKLRGTWTVFDIGSGWWNTPIPIAAGSMAVSAVWPAPTANPNVTRMVANVYTP